MTLQLAVWIATALEVYLGLGLLFAIPFAFRGAQRIDPVAAEGTLGFRLLILPGAMLLWPLLLLRWRRGGPPPTESNAHRRAASDAALSGDVS